MHMLKMVVIDVLLAILLFAAAAFIAGVISMQNPECPTCVAGISVTLWFAAVLALQPVLWARGLKVFQRIGIWVVALVVGGSSYLFLENVGAYIASSGSGFGLRLGFYANSVFGAVALFASITGVRFMKKRLSINPTIVGQ
jgi:hypothetical protein